MEKCKHDCAKPPVFPLPIHNRPALAEIDYRIGSYSRIREHMLDALNQNITLQDWSHRGADDPGIALLEGNALVGDILAFYQNLYANEIFLRTAGWRESVAELVRLSGYRLAPGVGGEATFALKVKGDEALTVPAGSGFKAQLEDRDLADEFESTEQIVAYPHLSEFNLYTPARAMRRIRRKNFQLELHKVDQQDNLSALQSVDLKKGDRMLLVPDSSMFDSSVGVYTTQAKPEVLIVSEVETIVNRVIISFEGSLRLNRDSQIRAYKIDRSFRHFGYNAAREFSAYTKNNANEITDVRLEDTDFGRRINSSSSTTEFYSGYSSRQMPLDQEVDGLALGSQLICQGIAKFQDRSRSPLIRRSNQHYIVAKTIQETHVDKLHWGNIDASTTVVTLNRRLMTNSEIFRENTDIRRTQFHEAVSPELTLGALSKFPPGNFRNSNLEYFGTYAQVKALAERELLLFDDLSKALQVVKTTSNLSDFETQLASRDESDSWLWTIALDQIPEFPRSAFSQEQPAITVYGNPIHTNQGKTEDEVVLGSGDSRDIFQTFAIPKSPLTYLLDESQTPAQAPELDIYVDNILWRKVDSFFARAVDDQVYVVREDNDSNSLVQFGDGVSGARLPSGRNNVVAVYRSGIGARGLLEADKKPGATSKIPRLEKVFLPAEVVGGGDAESADNARESAPGKLQSLGRLVGLADFEAEALALPGVLKVRADWTAPQGTALIRIVVLTETSTLAAVAKVQETLNGFNRCRGAARYPILVEQGILQYLYLKIRVGYAAAYRQTDISAAIKIAFGLIGEEDSGIDSEQGLFSLDLRQFGQGAHRSQILAAAQQVDGVTWVEIDNAKPLNLGVPPETDPSQLTIPRTRSRRDVVACLPERILSLHSSHLDLSLVVDATERECE